MAWEFSAWASLAPSLSAIIFVNALLILQQHLILKLTNNCLRGATYIILLRKCSSSSEKELLIELHCISDEVRIKASVKRAEQELEGWKAKYALEDDMYLKSSFHYVKSYLYESALFMRTKSKTGEAKSPTISSPIQLQMLLSCFCNIKEYLDEVLDRSVVRYKNMAMVEWTQLISAYVLMTKLSRPIAGIPSWDVRDIRGIASIENYLDRLADRLALCSAADPYDKRGVRLFNWWNGVSENMKKWVNTIPRPAMSASQEEGRDLRSAFDTITELTHQAHMKQGTSRTTQPSRSATYPIVDDKSGSTASSSALTNWQPPQTTYPGTSAGIPSANGLPWQGGTGQDFSAPWFEPEQFNPGTVAAMGVDEMWNDFLWNWPNSFYENVHFPTFDT